MTTKKKQLEAVEELLTRSIEAWLASGNKLAPQRFRQSIGGIACACALGTLPSVGYWGLPAWEAIREATGLKNVDNIVNGIVSGFDSTRAPIIMESSLRCYDWFKLGQKLRLKYADSVVTP